MGNCRSKGEKSLTEDETILKLHKLVARCDHKGLRKALNLRTDTVKQLQGLSLYHTFVISVVYNGRYHPNGYIEPMLEVLKDFKHIVGDVTTKSSGNRDMLIYTW